MDVKEAFNKALENNIKNIICEINNAINQGKFEYKFKKPEWFPRGCDYKANSELMKNLLEKNGYYNMEVMYNLGTGYFTIFWMLVDKDIKQQLNEYCSEKNTTTNG